MIKDIRKSGENSWNRKAIWMWKIKRKILKNKLTENKWGYISCYYITLYYRSLIWKCKKGILGSLRKSYDKDVLDVMRNYYMIVKIKLLKGSSYEELYDRFASWKENRNVAIEINYFENNSALFCKTDASRKFIILYNYQVLYLTSYLLPGKH